MPTTTTTKKSYLKFLPRSFSCFFVLVNLVFWHCALKIKLAHTRYILFFLHVELNRPLAAFALLAATAATAVVSGILATLSAHIPRTLNELHRRSNLLSLKKNFSFFFNYRDAIFFALRFISVFLLLFGLQLHRMLRPHYRLIYSLFFALLFIVKLTLTLWATMKIDVRY